MSIKVKNISKSSLLIFYIRNGKKIKKSIKPGEEIISDNQKTPEIIKYNKLGKLRITQDDGTSAPINRIITHNAIPPSTRREKEVIAHDIHMIEEFRVNSLEDILSLIEKNTIDYKQILDNNVSVIYDSTELFDISVIVPVRNREEFAETTFNACSIAAKKSGLKVSYTMVEHSDSPLHSKFCKKNKINYIWIKSEKEELFNKCLAQNIGAFFSSKSKYLLFHDIDCLMQSDFFINLFKNIQKKECRAIQNFIGRRVLYINPDLTKEILSKDFEVDNLSINLPQVTPPNLIGAPGGSITIERELFFEIGGYDPELFLANSPEDSFLWEKIDALDKMHICDEPDIELYHMYHPPTWMNNPHMSAMETIDRTFKSLPIDKKRLIIESKSNMIKKYK